MSTSSGFYNRLEGVFKYGFYITSFVLISVNTAFLIWNWNDLTIDVDANTIFLTFVGFLFAFAGINIYSIFNTNIENEKEALRQLELQYKRALELSVKGLQFPQDLIEVYLSCHYAVDAPAFNINSMQTIKDVEEKMLKLRDTVQKFKDTYRDADFELYREMLQKQANGLEYILIEHKRKIKYNGYFDKNKDLEADYNKVLDKTIDVVSLLRTYEYEPELEDVPQLTTWQKIKKTIKFAKMVFSE